MSFLNYLVLGIIYFIGSSTSFTYGIGYFTLYRPVFSGLLAGVALGDPMLGLMTGAIANLLFIDFTSSGGSLKGDPTMAGILAAMLAVKLDIMPGAAIAIAYPVSMIGLIIWKYRLSYNVRFTNILKNSINKNPIRALERYTILLPQLTLLIGSIVATSITSLVLFSLSATFLSLVPKLEIVLNTTGILMVILSTSSALLWFKYKYNIILFSIAYLVSVYFHFDTYLVLVAVLIISAQKRKTMTDEKYKSSKLTSKHLIRSWSLWMNFNHSCYNYELLQGASFSYSMVPILKKLYLGKKEEREDSIRRHFEFFNTEPNIGTAIHGYIIQLEDRKLSDRRITDTYIADTKKGLMGAVATMGESTTQTVLAPLLILGMIYGVVSEEISFFIISALMMSGSVLYLSLKGYYDGFYYGEEGVIRRVNLAKEIKLFKISDRLFVIILGLVTGETIFRILTMLKVDQITSGSAGLLVLFVIFNYLIRKGIKIELIILALYLLNIIFLIFV
ncbi:MAG: PTS system mannose/fructose/sorbose family transporter subunit IID [Eubacteriales bacterium]|nr:PTS system mannose/fructose/sorbose family transporter subunit IID [Eubacteriales bacterium]